MKFPFELENCRVCLLLRGLLGGEAGDRTRDESEGLYARPRMADDGAAGVDDAC